MTSFFSIFFFLLVEVFSAEIPKFTLKHIERICIHNKGIKSNLKHRWKNWCKQKLQTSIGCLLKAIAWMFPDGKFHISLFIKERWVLIIWNQTCFNPRDHYVTKTVCIAKENLRRKLHALVLASWVDLFEFVNLIESIYHLILSRWILFIQRVIFMDFLLPSTYHRQHHRSTTLLDRHGAVKRE